MTATSPVKDPDNPIRIDIVNLADGDCDTDASGDLEVTFPNLKEVYAATLNTVEGFIANATTFTAGSNKVTFRWFKSAGSATTLAAAANLSDQGPAVCVGFGR